MSSRRYALSAINLNLEEGPNAGLWLDKFITTLSKTDKESHSALAREVVSIGEPKDYLDIYNNWSASLEKDLGASCRTAEVKNRMAIGLGSEGVLETSVALHRIYGVPYIPGSALKGLAASFARHYCGEDWQPGKPFYEAVFGTTDQAGYVVFFDALYVPGSGYKVDGTIAARALHFDVMTVHHRPYYEEKKDSQGNRHPPADWDDPNPVPFISATGKYLIALGAPEGCEGWRRIAFEILELALLHEGVGAKTSSGYGRMKFDPVPIDPEQKEAEKFLLAIKAIPNDKLISELGQHASNLFASALNDNHKQKIARFMVERVNQLGRQMKRFEERAWFMQIQQMGGQ